MELTDNYLSFRFFFEKQDYSIYNDNLLGFLSVIAFLADLYEIKISSVYGYIVEALGQNWINTVKDQAQIINGLRDRVRSLNESNCLLSHQLIGASRRNKRIFLDLTTYEEFSKQILDRIKQQNAGRLENNDVILTRLGIDFELVKKVEVSLAASK